MLGDYYVECYNKVADSKKELCDLTMMEAVGYYLSNFKGNPVERLMFDIENNDLPYVMGARVRTLLEAIGGVK